MPERTKGAADPTTFVVDDGVSVFDGGGSLRHGNATWTAIP